MEIKARDLKSSDQGSTLTLGRNSKTKRYLIKEVQNHPTCVRVWVGQSFGGTKWFTLAPDEEIRLEP